MSHPVEEGEILSLGDGDSRYVVHWFKYDKNQSEEEPVVPGLQFKITFAQIVTENEADHKKFVEYDISVINNGLEVDKTPCEIRRRYSDFLEMYTKLRHEFPAIFSSLAFPKKVVLGNFSPGLMSFRRARFLSLLLLIVQHEQVRESASVIEFFQKKEQIQIVRLLSLYKYDEAVERLVDSFRLLNKLLTNRHPRVLQTLCLLVACCEAIKEKTPPKKIERDKQTLHYAEMAVRRFEGVSDTDSLRYYVPLLQLYLRILNDSSEKVKLQETLDCMKRRGMKVDECPLLDTILSDYTTSTIDS